MDLNFQKDNFKDQSKLSIQKLAFVGDAVFELIVRSKIVDSLQGSIGDLNSIKVKIVCCSAQSKLFEKIKDVLTEEEKLMFKRGRNAHIGNAPKNISPTVYHRATGLEVLVGFWYVTGNFDRLNMISDVLDILRSNKGL